MSELTGKPTEEIDLCNIEKYKDFEDNVLLHNGCRKILGTWRETPHKKDNQRYQLKCMNGEEGNAELTNASFTLGYHAIQGVVRFNDEDGTPKKLCMIRGPVDTGNALREAGWNFERYPGLTEDQK
jgi:hypothetical protein